MFTQLALDLQKARRTAGLRQCDSATLIGISRKKFSKIESGLREPSLREMIALSILYGKTFEEFWASVVDDAREQVRRGLTDVPEVELRGLRYTNRLKTLARLHEDLDVITLDHDA